MATLITTSIYPPEIGGLATYSSQFKRRVKDTEIVTLTDKAPQIKEKGVFYIKRANHLLREIRLFLSILRHSRGKHTIYALNFGTVGLPSMIVAKLTRKRFVVRFAGDSAWEKAFREGKTTKNLEAFLLAPDANNKLLKIQRLVLSKADAIITPSKYLAELLQKHYSVKAVVIPNAISEEEINYNPERNGKTILTIGRLVSYKRIDKIIENMPNSDSKLIVVGEGEEREKLEKLSVGYNVEFAGRLSHKEILNLMASCDFLVLYSMYEGMSHILLEAMWSGLPIIATRYPSNEEIITSGVNGLLVGNEHDLKWAMGSLLQDSDFRKRLAEKAHETIKQHTWEAILPKTMEVLSK